VSHSAVAVLYLLAVNALAFAAMAADKQRAVRDQRRIPERTLLSIAMLGGALGAVAAQQALRHKTRKRPFRTQLWLIAAGWTALLWQAAERIA